MGLQEYLLYCVQALERLLDFPVVHVVLGNESCDLDSAVSAITYAYYLHETSSAAVGTVLFLPLLNIPRPDFPLRTEITHFLRKFNITSSQLVFASDLDLADVKAKTDLKVTLVDHHVLSSSQTWLEENVVQIIDHRPKDGDLPDRCETTLELVGSCTTLVSEALLADETFTMDPGTAGLLHGTIVTDTINFFPAAGKTTPKDVEEAERLEGVIGGEVDRDAIFQDIKEAKFDLSGLTTPEILRKDLKLVNGDSLMVAMSSVTMAMDTLTNRSDFLESVKSFAEEKKVDAVVLLTLCMAEDDSVTRQLAVFSPSRVYRQQMADVLSASQSPNLGLSALPTSHEELLTFSQNNVTASRKQILPIVKGFLAGETTPDETQFDAYSEMPEDRVEGFTSMSSIVESRQNTFDGEITSEDLTSRNNSTEAELSPDESLLPSDRKVFDPLSSVHSSDSATSPTDSNKNAVEQDAERQLPAAEEILFDLAGDSRTKESGVIDPSDLSGPVSGEEDGATIDILRPAAGRASGEDTVLVNSEELSGDRLGASVEDSKDPPQGENLGFLEPSVNNPSFQQPSQESVSAFGCSVTGAENNTDPSQHNGLEEDALEQDLLNLASPHDLLFPTDSPLNMSAATSGHTSGQTSGQTSGHASKAPSYPVTPPNSYMEGDLVVKEIQLPSFNSSEMVEKIQEKKAALGACGGEDTDEALSPFTPQNSYAETSFPAVYAKETHLPSFHSSDMVERIREKRSSMERDLQGAGQGAEFDTLLDAVKSPFTPPNSFVEGSFDKYAHENLPSLNNAEIANKIKQKQAELTAAAGQWDSGTASPVNLAVSADSPGAPYTPQNSYRESHLESFSVDSHLTDLNEVAERLSLTGSESSGSLSEPKSIRASNRVHWQGLSPQEGEGFSISEMEEAVSSSGSASKEQDSEDSRGRKKGVSFSQQQEDQTSADVMEEAIQKIAFELANEMIQKALETFPTGSVKELVPPEDSSEKMVTHPSISDDSSPTMDESDRELSPELSATGKTSPGKLEMSPDRDISDSALASSTESERLAAEFLQTTEANMKASGSLAEELAQALDRGSAQDDSEESSPQNLSIPQSQSYEIETEYLSDMDPMHCVFSPDTNVIETDAGKEVVEGASFRKISGQEYQTVQEEILEQIRQEAKERELAKRRQSSVAEEDHEDLMAAEADDVNKEQPSEGKKKINPDADLSLDDSMTDNEGRKTIHVVRDRELYASALENVSLDDSPAEKALQPSDTSHPLLDDSLEDSRTEENSTTKKMIHASGLEDTSLVEEQHHYESFTEMSSLDKEEEERRHETLQGDAAKPDVSRTMSATSDVSGTGSPRGAGPKEVELQDEWQDDELPKMIGQGAEADPLTADAESSENRKKLVPDKELVGAGDNLENVEVLDSDSEMDSDMDNEQLEWENDTPVQTPSKPVVEEVIPPYTAAEERRDALSWKMISIGEGEQFRLDLRVIEPYKRVLSHGGYYGDGLNAMVVFSACYLPSRDRRDYSYVMNHLFHYVIHTLDELVADDYMIVYFHGATPRRQMPSFSWLKRCYQGIDRRLKKNLKALYLVHPTLWLKTVVLMTRPFISAKFSSKLQFVRTLDDLKQMIPMEYVYIPDLVQKYDDRHFHPSLSSSSASSPPSPQ